MPRTLTRARSITRTKRNKAIRIHKIPENQTAIPVAATSSVEVMVQAEDAAAEVKAKDKLAFKVATLVPWLAMQVILGINVMQTNSLMTPKAIVLLRTMLLDQAVIPTEMPMLLSLQSKQKILKLLLPALSRVQNRSIF
jgi:hypothetical protein